MALSFDANYYLQERPDVFQAFVASAGSTGLTWAEFAEQHYDEHGRFEGSNPNAVFNTNEYLAANPDVAAAGVNPFDHYLQNGAAEDRAPSASFISFASFSSTYAASYLASNPDLAAAGITTAAQAYTHFVLFGEFENRPGAPPASTGTVGSTLSLTAGVDTITGTVNNDTIVADGSTGKYVLSAADTINGGAGNDTLKIYSDGGSDVSALNKAAITNVETVFVNGAQAQAIDVSGIAGVTSVVDDTAGGSNTVTVKAQAVTFSNDAAGNTFTVASATDTTESVTLSKIGKAGAGDTIDLSGTKVTSASLTSTGAANVVTLTDTGTALTSLSLKGDQALTLTESINGLKTIDASTSAAGVTVNASGATIAAGFAFTGGVGNDSLAINDAGLRILTAGSQLNGGAGTDTLVISDSGLLAAADYKALNAATNFEVLGLGASATVDASQLTGAFASHLAVTTAGETTAISNLADNAIVDVKAATTSLTIGGAVGTHTETINLNTLATDAGTTVTTLNVNGLSTVNLVSNGSSVNTITNALGNSDNTAFNVTGSADLSFKLHAATTTGDKVDASAFTGALTLSDSGKGDVILGGSGATNVTLLSTTAGDTITFLSGHTKVDTVTLSGAQYVATDVVKNFVLGQDHLAHVAGVTLATGTSVDLGVAATNGVVASSAFASATAFITAAEATTTGVAGHVIAWVDTANNNTYLAEFDANGANKAHIVELVGVTATAVDATAAAGHVLIG